MIQNNPKKAWINFFFGLFSCLKFAMEISKETVEIVLQLSLNSAEIRTPEWNSE